MVIHSSQKLISAPIRMQFAPVLFAALFAASSILGLSTSAIASQGANPPKSYDDAPSAPAKSNAPRVFFKNLTNGASLTTAEFKVQFGVEGMKLHPAGELIKGTGHHHLIVNGKPVPAGKVVPADEKHIHFGKAQEETLLKLPAGKHTLTLQFADGAHVSYGPQMSETITVHVRAR